MGCRPPGWLCCVLPGSDRRVGGVQHQNCGGGGHSSSRGGCTGSRKERALQWAAFHSKGTAFPRQPLGPPPVEGSPLPCSGRGSRTQMEPCQPRAPRPACLQVDSKLRAGERSPAAVLETLAELAAHGCLPRPQGRQPGWQLQLSSWTNTEISTTDTRQPHAVTPRPTREVSLHFVCLFPDHRSTP